MNISLWAKGATKIAIVSAAFALSGTGIAVAGTTTGSGSIGGGNQANAPVSVPANICGNAIAAILGAADAACTSGASVTPSSDLHANSDRWSTSGTDSVLGGNQVNAPVSVPVNACGNAVTVLGRTASASCHGAAKVTSGHDSTGDPGGASDPATTSGSDSALGGNQVNAPVSVPVNVCGNAIAILGVAAAPCTGGASVSGGGGPDYGLSGVTSGSDSVGGGNQVNVSVSVPVNICGNSVAAGGNATSNCAGGAMVSGGGCPCGTTSGSGSVVGGNQVSAPVNAPVDVCGNSVAALGTSTAACGGECPPSGETCRPPHHGCPPSGETCRPPHHGCPSSGDTCRPPHHGCPSSGETCRPPHHGCPSSGETCRPPHHGCPSSGSESSGSESSGSACSPPPAQHGCPSQGYRSSQSMSFQAWEQQCCPPASGVSSAPGAVSHAPGVSSAPGAVSHAPGVSPTRGTVPPSQAGCPTTPLSGPGSLPTTGVDLVGLLAIGLGTIGVGAVSLIAMRRRRFAGRI